LQRKIIPLKDIEDKYSEAKILFDSALESERKAELEKNSILKEKEACQNQQEILQQDIQLKEKTKKELVQLTNLQNWLQDTFIPLTNSMEKHVMMTVYHEFNELFKRWFDILIEDDQLNVRLDDSFSTIVEQNGYETDIEHLSGGEKTSIALAYRLALNRVINDVMSTINTKDILILDEPTEGFSNNQLDKMENLHELQQLVDNPHGIDLNRYLQ